MTRRHLIPLLQVVVDLAVVCLTFIFCYWLRFEYQLGVHGGPLKSVPKAPFDAYARALIVILYLTLIVFLLRGMYERKHYVPLIDRVNRTIQTITLVMLLLLSLSFFLPQEEFQYSRSVVIMAWVMDIVLLSAIRVGWARVDDWLRVRGWDVARTVIVGRNDMALRLAGKLRSNPRFGYHILGYVTTDGNGAQMPQEIPWLGSIADIADLYRQHDFAEILLAEQDTSHFQMLELVAFCEMHNVRIHLVPSVYDLLIDYSQLYDLDGVPMVVLREKPMSEVSRVMKRVFDLVASICFLVITIPLWIVVALATRMDSRGPVIFRQKRAGQDGEPFDMLKFRTMVHNAEALRGDLLDAQTLEEPVFKLAADPRVTYIGRFLRRSSLDELPQLVNVLKGEMSFVGPRPEEVCFVEQYNVWQRRRLKVKPGITGLQQVTCRGSLSLEERVKYDIYYIHKQSFLLDLMILLRTIPVVFSGEGAV